MNKTKAEEDKDVVPIRFQGADMILLDLQGDRKEGAIAFMEDYENFRESYAHLFDGVIKRHGEVIGKLSDIEFI